MELTGITFLIVAFVLTAVEALKNNIDSAYLPLASVGVSFLISAGFSLIFKYDFIETATTGVTAGLIASGFYDVIKSIWKGVK